MGWFGNARLKQLSSNDLASLRLGEKTRYTPDVAALQRRAKQCLFIYDGMQARMINHAALGPNAGLIYSGALTEDRYTLWKKDAGVIPTLIPLKQSFNFNGMAAIKGDLILVPTTRLFWLDSLRENGVQFIRERVSITLPRRETVGKVGAFGAFFEETTTLDSKVQAWMYVGLPKFWSPLLDAGYLFKPVRRFTPKNPLLNPYYLYTEHERTPF